MAGEGGTPGAPGLLGLDEADPAGEGVPEVGSAGPGVELTPDSEAGREDPEDAVATDVAATTGDAADANGAADAAVATGEAVEATGAPVLADPADDPVFELEAFPEPAGADVEEPPPVEPPREPDFDLVDVESVGEGTQARWLWRVAIGLLVVASLAAVAAVGWFVVPVAARGVEDGVSWAVAGVESAAGEASDAWDRWSGSLTAVAVEVAQREPAPIGVPEGSRSLLLAVSDADRRGIAYALLARSPQGEATLALAPPGLLAVQPGFGDFPLSEATLFADAELAALTLTNLLGVRIDDALWLEAGELAASLPESVELDLPVPLIVAEGDEGRVLAKSGRAERSAAVVESVLATQGVSDQLEWLQRQGAVWAAVLEVLAADPERVESVAAFAEDEVEAAKLLAAVAGDPDLNITAIPVTQVSVGRSGDGYTLASELAEPFITQRFGHLLLRDGDRPRVELLNGNGRVGATRLIAQELVRRGYRVIKTDNASNFDYETTQVIAQGRPHRIDAQAVLDLLGSGELLLEVRSPSGVVDISIIVGQDIPAG